MYAYNEHHLLLHLPVQKSWVQCIHYLVNQIL